MIDVSGGYWVNPAVNEFQLIKRYNNRRKALNYNSGYLFKIHNRVSMPTKIVREPNLIWQRQ